MLLLGYGFLFTYILTPLQNSQKHFGILWITVYNDTINILERYLLLQNTLTQKRSHRATRNCSFADFQSTFRTRKYFVWNAFSTHSRSHPIPSLRPRASATKNKLLWVVYTHKESYKILGTFGKLCESPKGFPMTRRNLLRSSLFHSIMYKYEASPPSINITLTSLKRSQTENNSGFNRFGHAI